MGEEEERRRSGREEDDPVEGEGVVDAESTEKMGDFSTKGFSGRAFFFSLSSSRLVTPSLHQRRTNEGKGVSNPRFVEAHHFSFPPFPSLLSSNKDSLLRLLLQLVPVLELESLSLGSDELPSGWLGFVVARKGGGDGPTSQRRGRGEEEFGGG